MHDSTHHAKLPAEVQGGAGVVALAENNKPAVAITYFGISLTRLILLAILTSGLYQLYWFYRNWQAIKKAEQRNIWPFWRAFFWIFFLYSLFKKIYVSAKHHEYPKAFPYPYLAVGYFVLFIISAFFKLLAYSKGYQKEITLFSSAPGLFYTVMFLPIQKAINFNNTKLHPNSQLTKTFARGEVLIIAIGLILSSLWVYSASW